LVSAAIQLAWFFHSALPFSIAYHERFITSLARTSVSSRLLEDDLQQFGKNAW
jgi:hypothetical protein